MQNLLRATSPKRRRSGPRVALASRVEPDCDGTGAPPSGASPDFGLGDLCIEMPTPVELAAMRAVRIRHGRRDLSLRARGAWKRALPAQGAALLGVEFQELDAVHTAALWEILNLRALELTRFLVEHSDLAPIDVDLAMDVTLGTRRRQFAAGEWVYEAGASPDFDASIFIVAHGRVQLEARSANGDRVILDQADTGQVFGGAPTLLGVPHVDSALALEPIQLLEVDAFSLRNLLAEQPLVARALEQAALRRYLHHILALLRRG
jgi:hypothetical protein